MYYDRRAIKLQAKASLREAYPHPMLVTLVFMLAAVGVPGVITYFVSRPFLQMYQMIERAQGMDPDAVFANLAPYYISVSQNSYLYLLLYFLVMLFLAVFSFGYVSYSLRLARGEQPSYRNLLDGFYAVGRVVLTALLMFVFLMLWGIPGTLLGGFLVVLSGNDYLSFLGAFLLWAFYIWLFLRYTLSFHFLVDHPEMTALQAITASKQAMKGHKGKLIVLYLSFYGWMLLAPFTLGILYLWLFPYMMASVANFYDFVTGGLPPRQAPDPLPGPETGPGEG